MPLALRAHRGLRVLIGSVLLAGVVALAAGSLVELPQLLQGISRPLDVALIVSTAFAPLTGYMFDDASLAAESRANRRLVAVDVVLVGTTVAPSAVIAGAAALTGHPEVAVRLVRDVGFMVGLTLAVLGVARARTASTVPVVYFLAVTFVGLRADGTPYWWAWPRADPTLVTVVPSVVLLAVGFVLLRWRARRRAASIPELALVDTTRAG